MKMRIVCLSVLLAFAPLSAISGTVAIDPALILPPPPADGSPAQKAELAEVEQAVAARTPEMLAQAKADDALENPMIYKQVLGDGFDFGKLPATAKLFDDVMNAQRTAANDAKKFFSRNRPWVADPSLATCAPRGGDRTSYPSGHATMGFATGVMLAALVPEKAQAILARASGYAENRIVCGMHYRRDIVAGQVIGTTVAVALLRDPAFKPEFDAAEQELKAAHLAQ